MYWFQVWPQGGVTCISSNFGHQVALLAFVENVANCWFFLHHQVVPLALVTNLAARWHNFHWFQFWPPGGATCISYKFGHQVAPLALSYCLGLPYWQYQLVSSSARVTSVKFQQGYSLRDNRTHRSDPRDTWVR